MQGELLEADLVHDVVGAFYTVYNYFGYGLHESIYMDALDIELKAAGHEVAREIRVPVFYKGHRLRSHRLDRLVDRRLVVEGKARERLTRADGAQLVSYLRASPFSVGLLLHFGPEPYFKRYVYTGKRYWESPRDESTVDQAGVSQLDANGDQ